ncbi:cytochrome P450 [Chloropicon primus]|nr:cytochrome P450 [Chloropicon primus]
MEYVIPCGALGIALAPGVSIAVKLATLAGLATVVTHIPMVAAMWRHRTVPTAGRPLPFVGNMLEIFDVRGDGVDLHLLYDEWAKEYGPVFKLFIGTRCVIVAADLDLVREVTLRKFSAFNARAGPSRDSETKVLGEQERKQAKYSIFNTKNPMLWKGLRSNANAIFHSVDKMAGFAPLMKSTADELADRLALVKEGESVDIWRLFGDMTLDVIGSTVFGVRFNSIHSPEGAEAVKAARTIFKYNILGGNPYVMAAFACPSFLQPALKTLSERYPTKAMRELSEARGLIHEISEQVYNLATAEEDNAPAGPNDAEPAAGKKLSDSYHYNGNSFLKLFIEGRNRDTGAPLQKHEILPQAFIFLLAGYETTANTLGSTIYMLTQNKEAEEKLIEEIDRLGKGKPGLPSIEELKDYKFLDAVLNEVLRIMGPAPLFTREALKDVDMSHGGVGRIVKGTSVHIASHSLHMNPKHWPEPRRFLPERFVEGTKAYAAQNHKAWMPFGSGPRMCVASGFALVEAKLALITLYRRFRFEHAPGHKFVTKMILTVGPVDGIQVLVKKRE